MGMPPQLKSQLLLETSDPNGTVAAAVEAIWLIYLEKQGVSQMVRYQYVKKAALDIRLGEEHPDVDYDLGKDIRASDSQVFDHLQQMRTDCLAEIARLEGLSRANRVPVSGAITKVTPSSPPFVGGISADDPSITGDPYYGSSLRRP